MILKVSKKKLFDDPSELCFRPPFSHEDIRMMMYFVEDKEKEQKICEQYLRDSIVNVIFNPPATIVFWDDGKKTVVKAKNEPFDPEKGLAMAICKRFFGNQSNYYDIFKRWVPLELMEEAEKAKKVRVFEPCELKLEQEEQKEPDGSVEELHSYRNLLRNGYMVKQEAENGG